MIEILTTDSGCENPEIMLQLMEEHDAMTDEITELCDQFVSNVKQRMKQLDTQYLSGIRKFFVTYLNTIQMKGTKVHNPRAI